MLLGQKDRKEKQDERRKKGKERRKRNEGSGLEEQSDKFLKAIGMLTKTYTEIIKI